MAEGMGRLPTGLAERDASAVGHIWDQCFERLVRLARRGLDGVDKRINDEEDIVPGSFPSFSLCRDTAARRFPQWAGRDDFWRLLAKSTARKVVAQQRWLHRQKRGDGKVRGESALIDDHPSRACTGLDQMLESAATPGFAAGISGLYPHLRNHLPDGSLKAIAMMKLEGYTN